MYRYLLLAIVLLVFGALSSQTNLALNKPTRQSSDFNAAGASSKAVDGNKNGNWTFDAKANSVTHTKDEKETWWEVDLGDIYYIDEIRIWNRRDCCWERLQNFFVFTAHFGPNGNYAVNPTDKITGPHSFTQKDHPSMHLQWGNTARFVRIYAMHEKPTPLSLTEVEVFGRRAPEATNIAKGQPTRQSSDFNQYGVSSKAVDGNTAGGWSFSASNSLTHTKDQENPWWEVDLGSKRTIQEIKIHNRTDGCCWDRLSDIYVLTSDQRLPDLEDDVEESMVNEIHGPLSVSANNEILTIPVSGSSRYVRIYREGERVPLSLAEVEVIGF